MGCKTAVHELQRVNNRVPYTESQQELIIFKACKHTTRGNGLALTREAEESL